MHDLASIVTRVTGQAVVATSTASGGSISRAGLFTLADGQRVFAKTLPDASPGMFRAEAEGLGQLAGAGSPLTVPRVIAAGPDHLVTEAVETGPAPADFARRLGAGLAELHRNTPQPRFGFGCDNDLGATAQNNTWSDDWPAFWRDRRLGPMLDALGEGGELDRLGRVLMERLERLLEIGDQPACLLHGDLWTGNVLATAQGPPALIDPACYFGHREADLGIARLFGFGPGFERAYRDAWPIEDPDGFETRLAIYELHHHLNHLLLFGQTYRAGCMALLHRLIDGPVRGSGPIPLR